MRASYRQSVFLTNLVNVLIISFIGIFFIAHGAGKYSFFVKSYYYLAFLSQAVIIYLILYLLLLPLLFSPARKALSWVVPVMNTVMVTACYLDYKLFTFFKMHFNGLVWNVVSTPGGWNSLAIGVAEMILYAVAIIILFLGQVYLFKFFLNKQKITIFKRKWAAPLLVFFLVFSEKMIFAYGDLYDNPKVTRVRAIVPFHQPLTLKKAAAKYFDVDLRDVPSVSVKQNGQLQYPINPLQVNDHDFKYNIVWIVVDCFRVKEFGEDNTPFMHNFAKRSVNFTNHLSGGNATRNGLFSMFYGLYSSYWNPFMSEKRGPIFINSLLDNDYEFSIYSSQPLTFPEFRKTIFVDINDQVNDKFEGQMHERDRTVVNQFKADINQHSKNNSKFFGFVFLDSAHSAYSFPGTHVKYEPYAENVVYSDLTPKQVKVELKNRYKNALLYIDDLVKEVVNELEANDMLKNTVVLVTGDHGEEFWDHGFIGHSGGFTREQVQVPLMMYHPDLKPRTVEHLTTHHDLPATFLQWFGVSNNSFDYSHGLSLLSDTPREFGFACGWDKCSIIDEEGWVIFGAPGFHPHLLEFLDANYEPVSNAVGLTAKRQEYIREVMGRMTNFSK